MNNTKGKDPRRYQSIGGYAGLVKTAIATGDLSILSPLSLKDAIWLECERARVRKQEVEYENSKMEFFCNRFDSLFFGLMDNREILRNIDVYVKCAAFRGAKHAKIDYIDVNDLPSTIMEKERAKKKELEEKEKSSAGGKRREDIGSGSTSRTIERATKDRGASKAEKSEGDSLVTRMWMHMKHVQAIEAKEYGKPLPENGASPFDKNGNVVEQKKPEKVSKMFTPP